MQADSYPDIRVFTVGQKTASPVVLDELKTIEQVNYAPFAYGQKSRCHKYDRAAVSLQARKLFDNCCSYY